MCRIDRRTFSKCIAFEDISYQLAQPETRTAIFEHLCDLYNYVDASIHVQLLSLIHIYGGAGDSAAGAAGGQELCQGAADRGSAARRDRDHRGAEREQPQDQRD